MPPPVPPRVNDGRRMTGKPILLLKSMPSFRLLTSERFRDVETDGGHRVFEEQAVFGLLDGAELRADELHVVLFEHAAVGQLDREIQRGLSAHSGQQRKDAGSFIGGQHLGFNADDFFQVGAGERLDVGAVGHLRIGHDGGRIGVGQHHFVAFGLQRLAGLRAGVVELGRLANDDGPGADDKHFRDVVAAWHVIRSLSISSCVRMRHSAELLALSGLS